jgi:hypothetical protein
MTFSAIQVCPAGSFSWASGHEDCLDCPTGAVCGGGTILLAQAGYYREGDHYISFFKCNPAEACRGKGGGWVILGMDR